MNNMISQRQLFLQHIGQTSESPMMLEIESAKGIYLIGADGKKYIDLVAGVSVSNLGHSHPAIVKAVKLQAEKHMHLMVYGEIIQSPQVKFAELLSSQLPDNLESTYFVNSGSEAVEGALKLAKRYTGRTEIIAFKNAYHGSTHGALSLMSDDFFSIAFRPLLPNIKFLEFSNEADLEQISEKTACVIVEPVQGEAGVILPENDFLKKLQNKCNENGTLLIFDEIQTGFGRTGKLFAFQKYNVEPDIVTMAKAMGGGMPIGAFISSKKIMDSFMTNPVLGHITTFGGHPVSAAAALANLKVLLSEDIINQVDRKAKLLLSILKHDKIKSIRGVGLFYSVELESAEMVQKFFRKAIENGILTDWFLFNDKRFRISPPLIITDEEIKETVRIILKTLDEI
ncbi:MAG: aspartate aminotransferase family protein [Bacteroidales bacterium]|nr:aspartate aminotransferase family protein [Bacteroidales bacterium]MBN2758302.1 aspartate aminotransferase family protein [Bacteroidales bacterium]